MAKWGHRTRRPTKSSDRWRKGGREARRIAGRRGAALAFAAVALGGLGSLVALWPDRDGEAPAAFHEDEPATEAVEALGPVGAGTAGGSPAALAPKAIAPAPDASAAPTPQPDGATSRGEQTALVVPGGVAGADERPPWRRFAAAAPPIGGRPMIAVVIDDLGLDEARSRRAIALEGPLTLAFLPYSETLPGLTQAGRAAGHELLVHVPMEPVEGNADPGPNALLVALPRDELRRRLEWTLGRFGGYVGLNNHMGSLFTQDRAAVSWLLAEVKARGLLFLDSRTTAASQAARIAAEMGVPHAERHVFLDNSESGPAVRARLAEVEALARSQGYAVAIGHPRDATLDALAEWLPTLEARGLIQVPVSALVGRLWVEKGPTAAHAGAAG